MKKANLFIVLAVTFVNSIVTNANPVMPYPTRLLSEQINIEIESGYTELNAIFSGEFTFSYIAPEVDKIIFPVPPDTENIIGWMDEIPLSYEWGSEVFPTSLPEMPEMPTIEWYGSFSQSGGILKLQYEHSLIKRPGEFIYFYPFVFHTERRYPPTTVQVEIEVPVGVSVAGVWLDDIPLEYSISERQLQINFESDGVDPNKDFLLSLVSTQIYVATDGDDITGDGSIENPFRTIQKGIESAKEGEIVSVYPGVYNETIDFMGKAVMVRSAKDAAVLEAQDYFAVLFCSGEGPDSILKNFVIRDGFMAILIENGSPTINNVTIIDNGFGIAAYTGSQPYISNSIFWNNVFGDLFGCRAAYSCVQDGCAGPGNLDIDPRFADSNSGDYHLQSKYGRYWPAYDIWVLDKVISPCIDGGDPNTDYSNEPMPNGDRINMGAYGGTAYASKKEILWLHSDTNKDGWVNLIDFAMIALDWLKYKMGTSNLPPEVSIIKPQDGDTFSGIEPVEIETDAWDSDGSVEWVEFLANGDVIFEDNNGADGWTTNWKAPHGGDYSLTAEATDDDGDTTTSPVVEIHLYSPR